MEMPYSRQLNRPVRYFKFFTMLDLFIIVGAVIVVPQLLGMLGFLLTFAGYFLHLLVFRLNRRAGYDVHFFRGMLRPHRYRAGRVTNRCFVRRIIP